MCLPGECEGVRRHRLPEDPAEMGDAAWFGRLNAFEQEETRRQAQFKRANWPELSDGNWAGRHGYSYPHILAGTHWDHGLWQDIRQPVLRHFEEEKIALHREFANLRSSELDFIHSCRERQGAAMPHTVRGCGHRRSPR